jgi:hypothetical protein
MEFERRMGMAGNLPAPAFLMTGTNGLYGASIDIQNDIQLGKATDA